MKNVNPIPRIFMQSRFAAKPSEVKAITFTPVGCSSTSASCIKLAICTLVIPLMYLYPMGILK